MEIDANLFSWIVYAWRSFVSSAVLISKWRCQSIKQIVDVDQSIAIDSADLEVHAYGRSAMAAFLCGMPADHFWNEL